MRSLKEQVTFLVMGSIALLLLSLMCAFYFQVRSTALMAAETKAKSDLAAAEAIINLKYPGPWQVRGGDLYKGVNKINDNAQIVDYIGKLTGDSCTVFLNDARVATTVRDKQGKRAIGTHAATEVTDIVLGARQQYVGEAAVVGKLYQTAYKPITDDADKVVGMLYVGAPRTFYDSILYGSLKVMGLAGLGLTILIGLLTWWFITRRVVDPLREVIQGTRQVAMSRGGRHLPVQGSNEIGELAEAFNQMVDKMQDITSELRKVNQTPAVPQTSIGGVAPEEVENYTGSGVGEELEKMLDPGELPKGLNRVTLK
jgi:methyl-accepting chemotaxis protein